MESRKDKKLNSLQSAVTASLPKKEDDDEEDLELLRAAALKSRKATQANNGTSNSKYKDDKFKYSKSNRRTNLVVVSKVEEQNGSMKLSGNNSENSNSPFTRRKGLGKFSRFESDSDSDDTDEDYMTSSDCKSPEFNDKTNENEKLILHTSEVKSNKEKYHDSKKEKVSNISTRSSSPPIDKKLRMPSSLHRKSPEERHKRKISDHHRKRSSSSRVTHRSSLSERHGRNSEKNREEKHRSKRNEEERNKHKRRSERTHREGESKHRKLNHTDKENPDSKTLQNLKINNSKSSQISDDDSNDSDSDAEESRFKHSSSRKMDIVIPKFAEFGRTEGSSTIKISEAKLKEHITRDHKKSFISTTKELHNRKPVLKSSVSSIVHSIIRDNDSSEITNSTEHINLGTGRSKVPTIQSRLGSPSKPMKIQRMEIKESPIKKRTSVHDRLGSVIARSSPNLLTKGMNQSFNEKTGGRSSMKNEGKSKWLSTLPCL